VSDAVLIAGVAAAASVSGAVFTAAMASWSTRKTAGDANRIEGVEVAVGGMEKLVAAQDKRIGSLEREVEIVKGALLDEQQQHAATRELLRIAMRHIRDMLSWLGGDRTAEPPNVPDELTHQL
jgi:hypothetical protein